MNTNPFNNIAAAPYVSKRRALPLDEMLAAAQNLEERYQTNKANMDKMGIWASNLDLGSGDEYLKQQALERVNGVLSKVSENEGAYENATDIVSSLAKEVASDHHLNIATQNQQERRKWEQWADQQRAAGHNILDFHDPNFRTVNDDGTVNHYKNGYEIGLNYGDKMHDIWKGILKEEEYGADLPKVEDLSPDNPFVQIIKGSGIGDRQLLLKKGAALEQYMQSPEYAQQMKLLANQGMDANTANEAIANSLDEIGVGLKTYNDKSYILNSPEYVSSYQKGMLDLKYKEQARKAAKDREDYFKDPVTSPGASTVVSHFGSVENANNKIRNAADPAEKGRLADAYTRSIDQFANQNEDVKNGLTKLQSDFSS